MKQAIMRTMLVLAAVSMFAASMPTDVEAKAKKKQLTAEQKKKYHAEALKLCRKKYSMYQIERVEVNWTTMRVTCWLR